jgi:hypothetical protein
VDAVPALNVVKAGQTVPLRWSLLQADGSAMTTLSSVKVTATSLACGLAGTTDLLEETPAGGSGLQNQGGGHYQFNWKTPSSYAGSCKVLHLDLGEGITRDSYFKFKK